MQNHASPGEDSSEQEETLSSGVSGEDAQTPSASNQHLTVQDRETEDEYDLKEARSLLERFGEIVRVGWRWIWIRFRLVRDRFRLRRWETQRNQRLEQLGRKAIAMELEMAPSGIRDQFDKLEKEEQRLEDKIQQEEEKIAEIRKQIESLQKEREQRLDELAEKREPLQEKWRLNQLSEEKVLDKKENYQEKLQKVENRLEMLDDQKREQQPRMATATEGAGPFSNSEDRTDLQKKKGDCEEALDEVEEELKEIYEKRQELDRKRKELRSKRRNAKRTYRKKLNEIRSEKRKHEKNVQQYEQQLDDLDRKRRGYSAELGEFLLKQENLNKALVKHQERIQRDEQKIQELENYIDTQEVKLQDLDRWYLAGFFMMGIIVFATILSIVYYIFFVQ